MRTKTILFVVFVLTSFSAMAQTSAEYFKTLQTRVNTQGTSPSQEDYNFYVDKMTRFFYNAKWQDEVVSIKVIKVKPPNDPTDWYYFAAVKTKNCPTDPFYVSYDIGDSNLGMLFTIENKYPAKFQEHINKLRANIPLSEMNSNEKRELAKNNWPAIQKRLQIFTSDTIMVFIDKTCHDAIDTLVKKYPEIEREAKRKMLWIAVTETERYKENASYMNNSRYMSETDLYTTFDDYSGGTVERAKNIYINMCKESLWTSARYVSQDCVKWLNDNVDKL
jgi:hypothetical protein